MKTILQLSLVLFVFLCNKKFCLAQLPKFNADYGIIIVGDRLYGKIYEQEYKPVMDSLNMNLKKNPNDTTSLFYKALLINVSNNIIAKPYQLTKGALENLLEAKNIIEKASDLGMKSLNFKILKAQIYRDIAYRYTGDETWMFTKKEIAERRKQYEAYKIMANKCIDELMLLDKNNAYYYDRLREKSKYPID